MSGSFRTGDRARFKVVSIALPESRVQVRGVVGHIFRPFDHVRQLQRGREDGPPGISKCWRSVPSWRRSAVHSGLDCAAAEAPSALSALGPVTPARRARWLPVRHGTGTNEHLPSGAGTGFALLGGSRSRPDDIAQRLRESVFRYVLLHRNHSVEMHVLRIESHGRLPFVLRPPAPDARSRRSARSSPAFPPVMGGRRPCPPRGLPFAVATHTHHLLGIRPAPPG